MKKFTLFLVLCLAVTILVACNKSGQEPQRAISGRYQGQTSALYQMRSLNMQTGEFGSEDWDSTYADYVIVAVDDKGKKIKFTFSDVQNKALPGQGAFEFDYTNDTSYISYLGSHITQSFYMKTDSLYSSYFSYLGYGPNYTRQEVKFAGKKVF